MFTFRNNQKKVNEPLKLMIYEPSLCEKGNNCYLYFEIYKTDIHMLNLDPLTQAQILKRNEACESYKIRFMAYNTLFVSGYYALIDYRAKAVFHMFLNGLLVIFMQYYFYFSTFCLFCFS